MAANKLRLSAEEQALIVCPRCRSRVEFRTGEVQCRAEHCGQCFPVVNGVPVLIDDSRSVFDSSDFLDPSQTWQKPFRNRWTRYAHALTPPVHSDLASSRMLSQLAADCGTSTAESPARILVVGVGPKANSLPELRCEGIDLLKTDLSHGPDVDVICDAHHLPLDDGSMDAVVVMNVLEHVLDPWDCVQEIHRVLRAGGYVYAQTPFVQQVHGGAFDYTRFTPLGHRWLFRDFDELESGIQSGPGMALARSTIYWGRSLTNSRFGQRAWLIIASWLTFWLRLIDGYMAKRPAGFDAAAEVYFYGSKSPWRLSPRELISNFRGIQE